MISAMVPAPPLRDLMAMLPEWLPQQRWFGGKQAAITSVAIADRADFDAGALILLLDVNAPGQPTARYLLLPAGAKPDSVEETAVRRRWFELLASGGYLRGAAGSFSFENFGPRLSSAGSSRLLGAEQTNSSIFYSRAGSPGFVLKLFRRLQPGENPEFEIPRALFAHTGFRNLPAVFGRATYRGTGGTTTLAVLQAYVPNHGDGWAYTLARLRAGADEALLRELTLLGRRTAELHAALASIRRIADFAPEPITAADAEHWRLRALAATEAELLRPYSEALAPWRARLTSEHTGLEAAIGAAKTRIHGDYHLGQVLKAEDDFYIIDFEGEPARPMAERRQKGNPLQDVAGMLRSFSYAAHAAGRPEWEADARAAFLTGYGAPAASPALNFFECEKAVYELGYELAHRPDWVGIPLRGLAALLAPHSPPLTPTS